MKFSEKSAKYLIDYYVKIRDKQAKNGNFDNTKKKVFSPRDLVNVKKEAIKICKKRKGKQVSIGDVKKVLRKR